VCETGKRTNAAASENACIEERVLTERVLRKEIETALVLQKGHFMKTIFTRNNRGKAILYILLAVAVLALVALFFCSSLLPQSIFFLALTLILMGIMFLGSLIIQVRSGPPW
jgi:high-affinity Fe2+/Pb2+ permease